MQLKPGIYLQYGDSIKALSVGTSISDWFGASVTEDAATLAHSVSWSFIALRIRRETLREFESRWERNGEPAEPPFAGDARFLLSRIDEAVQVFGAAYLLKERAGRMLGRLRWLDPRTISYPTDEGGWEGDRPLYYVRMANGRETRIPAEDVLAIVERGISETRPATSAAAGIRALMRAVYNLDVTAEFLTRNPTPVLLLVVPPGTRDVEKQKLRSWFSRMLNRSFGSAVDQRVMPVSQGVETHAISFAPKELLDADVDRMRATAILAAYGVPATAAIDDAANYATAESSLTRFLTRLGGAARRYAYDINHDDDIKQLGYKIVVPVELHPALQRDESDNARAMQSYVMAGLTPQAAAYILGITVNDFPPDMEVFAPVTPVVAATAGEDAAEDTGESAAEDIEQQKALEELARYERKALRVGGACKFVPDMLTPEIVMLVNEMLETAKGKDEIRQVFAYVRDLLRTDAAKVAEALRKAAA